MKLVGKVHTFNTGRRYTANGQEIVWAVFRSDNPYRQVVVFMDLSRYIDGTIDLHIGNLDLVDNGWVLRAYDDHHYYYNREYHEALRLAREAELAFVWH